MIFAFTRKSRFRVLFKKLQIDIQAAITDFAVGVTEEFESIANHQAIGPPAYPLFFPIEPPQTDTTHLNQLILCLDGLSFFAHALDRFSFRPDSEALRAAVVDATVPQLVNWLEAAVADLTPSATPVGKDEILNYVDYRSSQYIEAPSLLGTNADDKNTALWMAAETTAEDVDCSKDALMIKVIHRRLMRGLANLDLATKVEKLEKLL